MRSPWSLSEVAARRITISLTGYLLDYPFTYYLDPLANEEIVQSALNNVELIVVELLLEGVNQQSSTVLKCSVPTSFRTNSSDIYAVALNKTYITLDARLRRNESFGNERLEWKIIDSITLDKVSL